MDHQEEALKAYIGLLRSSSHLEQVAKQDVRCYGLESDRIFRSGTALS